MSLVVRVPNAIAADLQRDHEAKVIPSSRGGMDVFLTVLATGSNLTTLMVAPHEIAAYVDNLRKRLKKISGTTSVDIKSARVTLSIDVQTEEDVEAVATALRAALRESA